MTPNDAPQRLRTRVPSGVPGLDDILQGGLMRGSVMIVQGSPGAGKTVLGNQFSFTTAANGGRVLYLTLLSESHGRLLSQLSGMSFFDPQAVATAVRYVSGFDTLEREGIKGVLRLLATEAKSLKADAIVLDGLFVLEENAESTRDFRKFINAMSLQAEVMDCTVLLLTNSNRQDSSPEYTMVDGWIEVSRTMHGHRMVRRLQVHKQRGSGFMSGLHMLEIGDEGVVVRPRLELLPSAVQDVAEQSIATAVTGCGQLDRMLGGGVRAGSTTLLLGPAGVGKTTLGLQYLHAGGSDPSLVFGFYETPDRLLAKSDKLGLGLRAMHEQGSLEIRWNAPTELELDALGHELLQAVRRRGVRRLLIDGIDGFRQAAVEPQRLSPYLTALANALRAEGCTTLFTMETPPLFGRPQDFRLDSMSAVAENLLLMRYREVGAALHRTLSVIKVRDSAHDAFTREFTIGDGGLRVGEPLSPSHDGVDGVKRP